MSKESMSETQVMVEGGGDDHDQGGSGGVIGAVIKILSIILIICTFPLSLLFCVKV